MRKVFIPLLLFSFLFSAAQKDPGDSLKPKKKYYKYLGIQSNLLLQQFISFNSNSSINTNPYTFSYSKNNIVTGVGTVFGTGFNVSESASNDGVAAVDVQNVNITFRFGFEKKYLQNERFIPFWGIDFGAGGVYNKVASRLNQSFNSSVTVVQTTRLFAGPSFRGGLNFSLSKHIQIGTEFYFNFQIAYTETSSGFGGVGTNFAPFNIGFQAPTALYLIFKY